MDVSNNTVSSAAAASAAQSQFVPRDESGFSSLSPDKFLELLVVQLQSQDPTEPVGNDQIMNQLAMMRDLQASIDLSATLESITTNQQLSTAASFLGNSVVAQDSVGNDVTGVVERAFVRDGSTFLSIKTSGADESVEVNLSDVSGIEHTASATDTAAAA